MIKRISILISLAVILLTVLTGCQIQSTASDKNLPGIPIDTEKAESVSIYYGSICYSFYNEDKETIQQTASLFHGFSLKEIPNGTLDSATTYQIYFSNSSKQIAAINVDKNGMFYLPDTRKYYQVSDGTFHLEELEKLYEDSMNANGFNKNQCLIQ